MAGPRSTTPNPTKRSDAPALEKKACVYRYNTLASFTQSTSDEITLKKNLLWTLYYQSNV
jgi:hypothetical protein